MKRNNKNCILVALLILSMLLVGCSPIGNSQNAGETAGETTGGQTTSNSDSETTKISAEPTEAAQKEWSFAKADELRFIDAMGYTPKVKKLTIQTTNRKIDEGNTVDKWLENQLGVEIDWIIMSGSELSTKLNLLSASEELPDVISLQSKSNTDDYYNLLNDGLLLDLDPLLDKYGENIRKVRTDEQIEVLRHTDGKLYALNSNVQSDTDMVCIRKDWLDKLNLKVPQTTDEFRDVISYATWECAML